MAVSLMRMECEQLSFQLPSLLVSRFCSMPVAAAMQYPHIQPLTGADRKVAMAEAHADGERLCRDLKFASADVSGRS